MLMHRSRATALATAGFLIAIALVVVSAVLLRHSHATPATGDMSLFEAQGALTFGCALWQPLTVHPYDEDTASVRPLEDFYLAASNSEAVLIVARHDGVVVVSGLRCGISVDWRRFPLEGN